MNFHKHSDGKYSYLKDMRSVQLTEELLERSGFTVYDGPVRGWRKDQSVFPDIRYFGNMLGVTINGAAFYIETLHHLQNLFFDWTGTELEISLQS